jgi:hypothetical protein
MRRRKRSDIVLRRRQYTWEARPGNAQILFFENPIGVSLFKSNRNDLRGRTDANKGGVVTFQEMQDFMSGISHAGFRQ